jgi:hypothetical protein
MPGNIVSAVSEFLTPDLVSRMASVAGINEAALARRAVGAAAPAILSGLANLASKPRGAQSLADAVAKQSPNILETLASTIGGSGRLADVGQQMLTSLFGARAFGSLASTVGKFVGLGDGPVSSLLGLLTPAILGVLGREAGAGVTGLTQLFSAQKDQIAAAMPSGLSQALRASGFLDPASPVASMASRTDDTYRATREGVGTLARAVNAPAARPIHWAYWVLPLAAVAGLAWYMLGGETPTPPEGKAAYVLTTPKGAVSARAYFDRDVYNNAGEKIGVVKDLVVGPEGGIYAAVIGVGNALGIGEKDVAVTFSSIRVTQPENERRLVTDATKDALKEAPAYRNSSPPRN